MTRRRLELAAALVCALASAFLFVAGERGRDLARASVSQPNPTVAEGQRLFEESCSECHGRDARGTPGVAPSLRGAGAAAADFYLRTGRMPLADPRDQPLRTQPLFGKDEIGALVKFVAGFGGPRIPPVDPGAGDLSEGQRLFTENCAGCHQVVAQGGITTEGVAPQLTAAKPIDIAEAVKVGPYVMPRFPQLTREQVDSISAYVQYAQDPRDVGGWSLGHLGPIPEGMVAWLLAGAALLLIIRVLGERQPR